MTQYISHRQPATNNHADANPPTNTDDSSKGYNIGSLWRDSNTDKTYICIDKTVDAAIWVTHLNTSISHIELAENLTIGDPVRVVDESGIKLRSTVGNDNLVVGILQETGTIGEIKKVILLGGVSKIHTGLTAGSIYYSVNGSLTMTPGGFEVGVAVSENNLVLVSGNYIDPLNRSHLDATDIHELQSQILLNTSQLSNFESGVQGVINTYVLTAATQYNADIYEIIFGDSTSNALDIYLGSAGIPPVGSTVVVIDSASNFGTNNCIVYAGQNIKGLDGEAAGAVTLNVNDSYTEFVYVGGATGWQYNVSN